MSSRKPEAAPHLDLERFLPYRLSVLTNRVSNAIARDYNARFGLSVAEWRAMAVLGRFGSASATDICARTEMDKVTVSRAAKSLLSCKLVRSRTDPCDRRRTIYVLTAAGRKIHDRIVPVALSHETDLLDTLTPREGEQLSRLLDKLLRRTGANTG